IVHHGFELLGIPHPSSSEYPHRDAARADGGRSTFRLTNLNLSVAPCRELRSMRAAASILEEAPSQPRRSSPQSETDGCFDRDATPSRIGLASCQRNIPPASGLRSWASAS